MNPKRSEVLIVPLFVLLSTLVLCAECGFYKMMADAMGWDDPWESKGITFGIKSKGMTAIIPIPLPIPIFTKDKKSMMSSDKGDSGGSSGGGGDKGSDKGGGGGWEAPMGGNDWW